ncbi:MAG: GH109 [uncultured Phycisphaerae bacterium]|uniref:GH109 n=1 Tax=uncultured Phycisphaerae bacterium TaxID=904963 RepID=A0A6J4QFC5_9BACT|nr:MAG: GH109 [uncultured Phycisphaerae bacterium]
MSKPITRRRFVQTSLAATAAASVIGGRPRLLRAANQVSANEKLNVAFVGTGGQASSDFDAIVGAPGVRVVAMCDIDDNRLDEAMTKPAAADAKRYNDYRKMIEEMDKGIDAVVVAIPDHQHYHASMYAIKHGKHVYCEKPLCHDVWEARRLTEAAREKKVVTQMGTQIHGGDNYRRVVEKIRAGAIGKVSRVHVFVGGSYKGHKITEQTPVPPGVNWDLWLGTAPEWPYSPKLHPFAWRGWWDFGGGMLADMACHHMDLPTWALGLTAPTTVHAEGPEPDPVGGPEWLKVHYEYPAVGDRGPVHLTWYHGGKRPEEFENGKAPKDWGNGCLFVGDKGMMAADYGQHKLLPEERFKDYKAPEPTIAASVGHYAEWVKACRENAPQAALCRFDYAGPLTEAVLLGNVSHRLGGKKLEWDSAALKCTNAPEADKIIKRDFRKGWEI